MGKLKVIHFVQDISNKSGGLKSAIFNLSLGIKKKRIHPIIYTFSNVNELDDYLVNNISIRCIGDLFIFDIKRIIKFVKDFYEDFIRDDLGIIHIHGLWTFTPFLGFVVAKLLKRKYILSPHGMLMPNALSKNKFKKKWAILLYQKRIINESKVIVSSSDIETSAVKNFDKKLTVKKIPHGVEFPKFIKHIELNGCKTAVFLGRYNESKGIEQLLEIWCELNLSNWNLKIAGILEDINYFNKLKKKVLKNKNIELIGPVYGKEKDNFFRSADLFILPTKTENFGIVILEALSYGIPVLTTKAAPWTILNKKSIGWCVDNDKKSIKEAIITATNLNNKELKDMGKQSRKFVELNFTWEKIVRKYIDLYLICN